MKKAILTVMIGVFAVVASYAQGIGGKWKSTLEGPQGSIELTFKVDGTKLTGTVSTPMGDQQISNGVVDGNDFTYEVDIQGDTMKNTGKLENGLIRLTMDFPEGGPGGSGGPGAMTLTRIE